MSYHQPKKQSFLTNIVASVLELNPAHRTAFVLATASLLWIGSGLIYKSESASGEKAQEVKLPRVQAESRKAQFISGEIILKGKTEARKRVMIKAETSGTVNKVLQENGNKVEEGEVILTLAEEDRNAKLAQARALVKQREMEFEAAKNLSQKGFNSQVKFAETNANLNAAKALLASTKLDYERTKITAPFAGILQKRLVEKGDFLGIGTPIIEIVELDPITISAKISETNINSVSLGTVGSATLVNGRKIDGVVNFISSVADEATRTYTVELEATNPDGTIVEGMTAELRIPLSQVKAYPISPAILALSEKGEIGIKTVKDGVVEFHTVTIIKQDENGMWVGGLPDEIDIITLGGEFAKEGNKVEAYYKGEKNE